MSLYPGRPFPVGSLKYELADRNAVRGVRKVAMLEFGEKELLYDIPRIVGGGLIANLGHARGGSAILMGMGLRDLKLDGHIHSVDLYPKNSIKTAIQNLERYSVTDRVTLCQGSTNEWSVKLGDCKFDFVFVDADHSYEGVRNDFLNWGPLIVKGGLIGFHDSNQKYCHQVLEEEIVTNKNWVEKKDLHINRIRVFEKLT